MKKSYLFLKLFAFLILINSCSKDTTTPAPKLGDIYQGGIVYYILQPGDPSYIDGETHGFIAYEKDLDTKYLWAQNCASPDKLKLANLSQLGDGLQNTLNIVSGCPNVNNAANACNNLGWYLPSLVEMQKMKLNYLLLKNFNPNERYWTSTVFWTQNGVSAYHSDNGTSNIFTTYLVRPIKKF